MELYGLRFPIGEFTIPTAPLSEEGRAKAVNSMAAAPANLKKAVAGLTDEHLDTPYRPEGWTIRQVVHHLPDSHVNSYMRLKLALTEDRPTIRTYKEARWAELPDSKGPVEMSLSLLEAVHERYVYLWRRLTHADWNRVLVHPELGDLRVDALAALYAWHGDHHIAHITGLRDRRNW
jgi:hypothetical protein